MSTPLLDSQILKLRRRLGDIFNEDGTDITLGNVYLSTSGTTFPQADLIDIYNDAIRSFMMYMTKTFPTSDWWEYMPGYIVISENNTVTSGKLPLANLNPTSFQLIDMKQYNSSNPSITDLAVEIPPPEWFSVKSGLSKTRKPDATHIFYSIFADGSTTGVPATLYILPDSVAAIDLIYLKDHTDFVQDSITDLNGISQDGLRRVLIFAEVEARKWKSTEAADVPEAQLQSMITQDMSDKQIRLRENLKE